MNKIDSYKEKFSEFNKTIKEHTVTLKNKFRVTEIVYSYLMKYEDNNKFIIKIDYFPSIDKMKESHNNKFFNYPYKLVFIINFNNKDFSFVYIAENEEKVCNIIDEIIDRINEFKIQEEIINDNFFINKTFYFNKNYYKNKLNIFNINREEKNENLIENYVNSIYFDSESFKFIISFINNNKEITSFQSDYFIKNNKFHSVI